MILLIIDAQTIITNEKLYCFEQFVSNVKALLKCARENNIEVVYVRHDDGVGELLTYGTPGFEIYSEFKPLPEEKIFDKTVNSAFKGTGLVEYLKLKGQDTLIVAGLQTDYCIDASIKCGFEHGFNIIVPAYANTTIDNEYMSAETSYKYYNEFIWNGRYAKCMPLEDVIDLMKG